VPFLSMCPFGAHHAFMQPSRRRRWPLGVMYQTFSKQSKLGIQGKAVETREKSMALAHPIARLNFVRHILANSSIDQR
jgi:hypothetical protein